MKIECYVDGSSLNNGKPSCVGGWSAIFYIGDKKYVRYGHLPSQSSNNKGELMGILYTVHMLQERKDWDIVIYSDSQYCVKGINEWRKGWANKNYLNVKNMDLFGPLFKAWDNHGNCKINWVRGHNGNPKNEEADYWAGKGMRNIKEELTSDTENIRMMNNLNF
jgi:ribonuclease HI